MEERHGRAGTAGARGFGFCGGAFVSDGLREPGESAAGACCGAGKGVFPSYGAGGGTFAARAAIAGGELLLRAAGGPRGPRPPPRGVAGDFGPLLSRTAHSFGNYHNLVPAG